MLVSSDASSHASTPGKSDLERIVNDLRIEVLDHVSADVCHGVVYILGF
jgi:hypothetical protein